MYNLLNLVNSKYDMQLARIDENLLDKSVYEMIGLCMEAKKTISLQNISIKYSGIVVDGLTSVRYIISAVTAEGIAIKVSTKTDYELSTVGIFSRPLLSNIGYIDDNNKFFCKYDGTIHSSYIPVNGSYTYNSGLVNNVPESMYQLLSSVYAKNKVLAVMSAELLAKEPDNDALRTYIETRLASDDIEIANGYLQQLGIDSQTAQVAVTLYASLIQNIVKNIEAELGELK